MLNSSESDNNVAGEQGVVDGDIKDESGAQAKKPRRKRTMFPTEKVNKLELYFKENPYPAFTERESLSSELEIEETAINNWFKNKRAREIRDRDKTKKKKGRNRVTLITTTKKNIVDEESVSDLKDPLVVENKEEKNVDRDDDDDINKNPQPTSHSEDFSVYEFPEFENGRTEVTEAFEPILLRILSSPPK